MSQFTFNIADYRSNNDTRIRTMQGASGFPVMAPAGDRAARMGAFTEPAVVDIRQMRDAQRLRRISPSCGVYQRRGKLLRFTGNDAGPVVRMSARKTDEPMENEPGDLPPAA